TPRFNDNRLTLIAEVYRVVQQIRKYLSYSHIIGLYSPVQPEVGDERTFGVQDNELPNHLLERGGERLPIIEVQLQPFSKAGACVVQHVIDQGSCLNSTIINQLSQYPVPVVRFVPKE